MKRLAVLLLLLGTALAVVLVARAELSGILAAFAKLGLSGFAVIVALHVSVIIVMGFAWSRLGGASFSAFLRARLLRDSAAEVLPLSQIGGFVLGGRALVLSGVSAVRASATTIVDVTAELVAQMAYTALGLTLLSVLHPGSEIAGPARAAVVAMVVLGGGFVLVQARGAGPAVRMVLRLARMIGLLGEHEPHEAARALQRELTQLHIAPWRLLDCTLWHLLCWCLVGVETWLLCRLLGAPIGLGAALVIDSLISGLRSAAFMVPQALGVQEGGYMLLGALFGLTPEVALALSLVRRARDLVIGAPVLLIWQITEGRRVLSQD